MYKWAYKKVQRFIFVLILKYLPPCKDMIDVASRSVDGNVSFRENLVLKLHLIPCKPCVRFIEQSRFIKQLMQDVEMENASGAYRGTLSEESRERLKAMLKNSAAALGIITSI